MNFIFRYTVLLIQVLLIMFIAGNPRNIKAGGSTLSAFPHLLYLISIPLIITILIVHISRHAKNEFTWQGGIRSGELVSRWSAIAFTIAVVMYVLGFYEGRSYAPNMMMVLFPACTAFLLTYLLGIASSALATQVVLRMRKGAANR